MEHTKTAAEIRKRAEDTLDQMAKMRTEDRNEDYYTAYEAVCRTDLGCGVLKNLDDATAMMTGNTTSFDLEKLKTAAS